MSFPKLNLCHIVHLIQQETYHKRLDKTNKMDRTG